MNPTVEPTIQLNTSRASTAVDVVVVGGGIGCLCAAVLLGAAGKRVRLLEAASALGGKAGRVVLEGVEVDTGPSVLTLPDVFDEVFASVGMNFREEVQLVQPEPAFLYLYPDGTELTVHHELEHTLLSIEQSLGSQARDELYAYLKLSARIWEAADPHFVRADAPSVTRLLFAGWSAWRAVGQIDAMRTMQQAIDATVRSPYLRALLMRYATYNGSDVRRAPGTLGCIAHVELALGGYGVRGGMYELVRALERAALRAGVEIELASPVERVLTAHGAVRGVRLADGREISCGQVVAGGEAALLQSGLVEGVKHKPPRFEASMSAHTAIYRAKRTQRPRAAHTVVFPRKYTEEFAAIFDRQCVPEEPTIYVCAQESCHGRSGWQDEEPLFCMVNAPATNGNYAGTDRELVEERLMQRLVASQVITPSDTCLWWRTPAELAARFPGSAGALYGWASNDKGSAFRRPHNRSPLARGLYSATGSAHPGGGVPMVAQSGKLAARAALTDSLG